MMEYGAIKVERSLRYVSRPSIKKEPVLVYLLHGYGQLAYYFLQKVADVLPEEVYFVAPEGMHRFYLQGTSGRVGASWMTKEARELDIQENIAALNQLHTELIASIHPRKVAVIGFSQGGATAARWVNQQLSPVDLHIAWASVYPPDLNTLSGKSNALRNLFVLGNQDPYFSEEAHTQVLHEYRTMGFETAVFEGKHDLNRNLLKEQLLKLIRL